MKCPHCDIEIFSSWQNDFIQRVEDNDEGWFIESMLCPACKNIILKLTFGTIMWDIEMPARLLHTRNTELIFPLFHNKKKCSQYVPEYLAEDYTDHRCGI